MKMFSPNRKLSRTLCSKQHLHLQEGYIYTVFQLLLQFILTIKHPMFYSQGINVQTLKIFIVFITLHVLK